ncbi:MAG: DUF2066 domain-containing protein [Gammaproteobacteria bacterium]|nr:MAG: DUF2066 domain-containing protein [Gammaproteobacteria bacterium]
MGHVLVAWGAVQVPLYQAEVEVRDRQPATRDRAFREALEVVLDRLTGTADWRTDPAMAGMLPRAAQWVERYQYHERTETTSAEPAAGEESLDLSALQGIELPTRLWLEVNFAPRALASSVKRSGYAIWEGPRPQLVVWLLDDGLSGRRWVGPEDPLGKALQRAADHWGLPLVWVQSRPELVGRVQMADVAGGFMEDFRTLQAQIAGTDGYLLLKSRPLPGGTVSLSGEFALHEGDVHALEPAKDDPDSVAQVALSAVSRVLASRFAVAYDLTLENRARIQVQGVDSYHAYARTLRYLEALPPVEQLTPVRLEGDVLEVEVSLATSAARLAEFMGLRPFLNPAMPLETVPAQSELPVLYFLYPQQARLPEQSQ